MSHSVMSHAFSQVPSAEIQRSKFDRSSGFKATLDAGYLVPIFVDEALPGDTFSLSMNCFGRLSTPLHPFMDNMFLDSFFFFIPNRLLWDNWQKFMGEQRNPGDSTDYLVPTITSTAVTGYVENSVFDYFGLPTKTPGYSHIALPLRAYNLIYNEWFRDENLQNSVVNNVGDGPDNATDYTLLRRGKRHDYFTSCLPWPQKGNAVSLPLGTSATVYGTGKALGLTDATNNLGLYANSTGLNAATGHYNSNIGATPAAGTSPGLNKSVGVVTTGISGLYADLSTATSATINQLRQSFQIQRMLERDARGGTRYTEIIRSHFGVISPDARLQRPEYLGGGSTPVIVNPVAQTSSTDATTPQGNLAAIGTVSVHGHGFSKSFVEHGIIIGLVSVRADLNYQQGLDRMWSRSTRYDYYWPTLAHIGEQAVLNKEIYTQGTANPTQDAAAFGFQERYAEYRYKPSRVTGLFRSNATGTLDSWHLAQKFTSLPALNSTFIQDNPPVDRVVAVPSQPDLLLDCYIRLHCARPMSTYSVPGLIDHF